MLKPSEFKLLDIKKVDPSARVVIDFSNLDVGLNPRLQEECKNNSRQNAEQLFQVISSPMTNRS